MCEHSFCALEILYIGTEMRLAAARNPHGEACLFCDCICMTELDELVVECFGTEARRGDYEKPHEKLSLTVPFRRGSCRVRKEIEHARAIFEIRLLDLPKIING